MNEFIETIKTRRSVRKFQRDPIPEKEIREIIETGLRAPSAGNRQPWRIVRVQDQTRKNALAEAAFGQSFMADAPVVLVVCGFPDESAERYGKRGKTLYVLQDTAALTTTILLVAHSLGYGCCWIGAFDEGEVSRILEVPDGMKPVAMIPIGKPKGKALPLRKRKPISEVLVEESF
jgi:nitroreductase